MFPGRETLADGARSGLRLSVVVPATDAPSTVECCLRALAASDRTADEVVVAREPRDGGPAAARNAGAGRASGDVLVFVDADVEVHRDALARIERAFAAPAAPAAVFGSYDDSPAAPGVVARFRNLLHHHVHQSAAGPAETFWAGLGAISRPAWEASGGFDARRFPHASVEDIELGLRMREAGHAIVLDPELRGRHLKAWSLAGMVRTDVVRRGIPWVGLLLERRRVGSALNLGWRHRLSALASVALAAGVLARRPRSALPAGAALVALNRDFYALLAARGGARLAATGVALHALHHLCSVVAVPAGAIAHARRAGRA